MLAGKTLPVKELTEHQIKTMFDIMQKYYGNIVWGNFVSDLNRKCDVVLLCDQNDVIHGFTTLAIFPHDENTQLLFSGDTIIKKEYWGSNDLSQVWASNAFKHADNFNGKTYWLLLTKGYKTYKFLHTFYNDFYPCVDVETPQEIQAIIDKFAVEQYGAQYQNGILVAGKDFLKDEFDDISDVKLKNKHTAFFLEKNPNYKNGDELVCITEMNVDNLNRLGRRALGR